MRFDVSPALRHALVVDVVAKTFVEQYWPAAQGFLHTLLEIVRSASDITLSALIIGLVVVACRRRNQPTIPSPRNAEIALPTAPAGRSTLLARSKDIAIGVGIGLGIAMAGLIGRSWRAR